MLKHLQNSEKIVITAHEVFTITLKMFFFNFFLFFFCTIIFPQVTEQRSKGTYIMYHIHYTVKGSSFHLWLKKLYIFQQVFIFRELRINLNHYLLRVCKYRV